MKTVGVITNREKDENLVHTRILVESILEFGGRVHMDSEISEALGLENSPMDGENVFLNADLLICLGGDGTFLKAARKAVPRNLPMLGINLGSLGFLTEVERKDIRNTISHIFQGNYTVEERMLLEVSIKNGEKEIARDTAINDIVVSKEALSRILHVKTYINDAFIDTFPGDGLIISTPTGSTAYSLSAGGPIVEPDVDLILVTPICPHILYSRSIISSGEKAVKAVLDEKRRYRAMVTVDGQKGYKIKGGYSIEVRRSKQRIKIIRVGSRNFYSILRTKIYDRGECLRKNEI
ncbi:MAG: NAD(+)/NADH kinase [Clostridiales bacterium]|nr:NAD(+)/NADH kinase [Eubacteriales bacterium]MDH7565223.1 NAD(+)/NADH kinase [Clostridiales bacterium]